MGKFQVWAPGYLIWALVVKLLNTYLWPRQVRHVFERSHWKYYRLGHPATISEDHKQKTLKTYQEHLQNLTFTGIFWIHIFTLKASLISWLHRHWFYLLRTIDNLSHLSIGCFGYKLYLWMLYHFVSSQIIVYLLIICDSNVDCFVLCLEFIINKHISS